MFNVNACNVESITSESARYLGTCTDPQQNCSGTPLHRDRKVRPSKDDGYKEYTYRIVSFESEVVLFSEYHI